MLTFVPFIYIIIYHKLYSEFKLYVLFPFFTKKAILNLYLKKCDFQNRKY